MTEAEWLTCTDPFDLAHAIRKRVNSSRFRWLAVDWGSRIRNLFEPDDLPWFDAFVAWVNGEGVHPNQVCRQPEFFPLDKPFFEIAASRACAEHIRDDDPMKAATAAADSLAAYHPIPGREIDFSQPNLGRDPSKEVPDEIWENGGREAWWEEKGRHSERIKREFCAQFRCVAGNPFRPVALDPSWVTPTVVALATGIYEHRAFDRLPILADALQEAGCGNEDVLSHCRGDGPHVRGCWVVDSILGKQ
jgi:hypothetical protein